MYPERLTTLREAIRRHDRLYYVEARPEIGDAEFEKMVQKASDKTIQEQLAKLNDAHKKTIAELERQAIAKALRAYGRSVGGKEQAARALGISKATLYRKLKEYDLVAESF